LKGVKRALVVEATALA